MFYSGYARHEIERAWTGVTARETEGCLDFQAELNVSQASSG